MEHFDITQWTDYIHGFVWAPDKERMERHLQNGCERCRRLAELVVRIQRESAAEPAVPEQLVRAAKAVFQPDRAAQEASDWMRLPRLAAQAIFNSLTGPVLEGARSAAAAEAHMVYHAGDYTIDLQVERDPESNELALVGQVADLAQSDRPLSGVPVLLTVRDKVIARSATNNFGEFCLVGKVVQGLTLRLPLVSAGKQVVIPLVGNDEGRATLHRAIRQLACVAVTFLCLAAQAAAASYILEISPGTNVSSVIAKYDLMLVAPLERPGGAVYLVSGPDPAPSLLVKQVLADPTVLHFEANAEVHSETPATGASTANVSALAAAIQNHTPVQYFGSTVRASYVQQWATSLIALPGAHHTFASGGGIVAVIDTGVDPNHPALKHVLVPGYDFTRDQAGFASELADLDQSTVAILDQSTVAILDSKKYAMVLNQSTVAILDQDTVAILDSTKLPSDFGHGTMVAGLIHLVAPTARIMPLKAFQADGTASLANIVRAIYYAVDHDAKVINMSFSSRTNSPSVLAAMEYAWSHDVVCVASGGNEGREEILVYPAANEGVIGVGSTNAQDERSLFSNYETPSVRLAAPGEALITTYPGNNYAGVWGTSFSTALTSGAVALITQISPQAYPGEVAEALQHGHKLRVNGLGGSRLDVLATILFYLSDDDRYDRLDDRLDDRR